MSTATRQRPRLSDEPIATDIYVRDGRTGHTRCAIWSEIRQIVLDEYPTCDECGSPSTEVDHIWPRRWGGQNWRSNLRGLCGPCNRSKGSSIDVTTAPTQTLLDSFSVIGERVLADVERVAKTVVDELAKRVLAGEVDARHAGNQLVGLRAGISVALTDLDIMRERLWSMA